MSGLGVMASPEGARIDFARLRTTRRERLLEAMDGAAIDVLILGRPADVLYASGARQLWTAGARPFGPACIVVRTTERVHLLSTWDEGVPAELNHDDLFGLSWNPAVIAANLATIDGLAAARTIGTDSFSPGFGHLIDVVAPGATVVDAGPALVTARSVKTADEVAAIATATAIAESALQALIGALRPGVTERELVGVYLERIALLGTPTPPSEGVVCITPPATRRTLPSDRAVAAGDLVVLNPGALYAGYEGGVGRTVSVGEPSAAAMTLASRGELGRLIDQCRPGPWGGGELYGLGIGMEPPVVPPMAGAMLQEGMVVAVQSWVADADVGGFFEREVVQVTSGEPEVLGRATRGLTAAATGSSVR